MISRRVKLAGIFVIASLLGIGADKPLALNELQIRELVKQLGSDSFVSREQASELILRQGNQSIPALENGLTHPDYEVVRRSRILISLIRESDKKTKLQAFLEDVDGSKSTSLPGWERFEKLVGKSTSSRALYGQIYKADPSLMDEVENDKNLSKAVISEKAQWLHNSIFSPVAGKTINLEIGDIGAVLFAATMPNMELPQEAVNNITNLLYQPSARDAISASKGTGPFRKLLGTWMLQQTDPNIISQHLHLSQNMNMTEGLQLARRAASEKTMPVYTKTVALTLLGKMGTAEDSGLLRNFLNDETVVGNFQLPNQQKGSTQVRDVALAMLVHMSGQSHKEYGFSFARDNQALFFNPYMLGFTNQENRTIALKKWDTYFTSKPVQKAKS
jgi:hypothetical protein